MWTLSSDSALGSIFRKGRPLSFPRRGRLWPPLYFLPGILAGAAIDIPADENSASFKWLLLGAALLAWLAAWLCWRLWRSAKSAGDRLTRFLPRSRLLWLAPLMVCAAGAALVFAFRHPLMPVYLDILHKVILR